MIHAKIDLYVKDRKESEFPDSQTIAEMLFHDTSLIEGKDFLRKSDNYFIHISVFNDKTHDRGGVAYRMFEPELLDTLYGRREE